MSSEYNYDADAQYFPFFVLTMTGLITLPLTYSLLRSPTDSSGVGKGTSKAPTITTASKPQDADLIDQQRAKQKRKELRLKRMLTAATGWLVMAYMVYLMVVTARSTPKIWNPYNILDVSMSASEKQINSRYRRLSVTMHPDKRQPNPALNETSEQINDEWVEIVKAYKALTDEDIRNNWLQYGNPDGKQSTSFGIALPSLLVADGSGKYVLVFYGMLLGIGLPWLVGKWWYGMQKVTRERVLVTTAGNMFKEFKERMDEGDVVNALSSAVEFKDMLHGQKADAGLGKLEKLLLSLDASETGMLEKDKAALSSLDDAARRKTLALLWAYLSRTKLDDKTLEAEKYELAPTALQLNDAFASICLAYAFTAPVLSSYRLSQAIVQALPPSSHARLPLLQLPHMTPAIVQKIETNSAAAAKKEHLSIQAFMALPTETRLSLATAAGLQSAELREAETLATQLPLLKIEKSFFKVQGEKHILPSSLVQFVLKARFIPPGTDPKQVPAPKEEDLADPDPAEGDIQAQKQEIEQHPLPLAHAPYLARERGVKFHVFLADNRQGKIAVPPFTFFAFDKKPFETLDGIVRPTFNVVTMKMQFQAPPQPGEYKFVAHLVCDSYVGFDWKGEAVMNVEDPAKIKEEEVEEYEEDEISEPDEESIAGAMATLRGQPTANPNKPKVPPGQRLKKRLQKKEEEESDYESSTDEDVDSESETDTETDTDAE